MTEPRRKRLKTLEFNSSTYDSCEIESEATCGIIQNVTVKNFMCHEHLSVDFKERINVVQGRNGSGKSAILTAVVVALGGTTKITNRGSSFKDLIKYDKHTATVNISLKNEGRDAYKPDIYGTCINIERKIMDSGATSYCLKNASGKVVSIKREELKRMCDYFNLIVENPLMVLNQDMSRSFLNSLDPGNLYKFFYQATQLQQMTDAYNILNECLETTAAMIKDRDSIFQTIERELQEVSNQHKFCLKQESKRMKLKDLRKELVWARISEIENEKNEVEQELTNVVSIIGKSEEKQRSIEDEVKKSTQKYQDCVKKFEDLTNEIKSERQSYKEKSAAQSQAKCKWKDIQRELDKEIRRIEVMNREIEVLNSTIKRDFTEVQRAWDEHNKQHKEEIAKVQTDLNDMEQVKKTDETHLSNIQNTLRLKEDHLQQLKMEENMNNRKIKDLEQELKNLRSRHTNSFSVFGTWVQPLLEKIEVAFRQKKFSAKPVGPLGAYIEMQDNRWTHIAEMVIGSKMSAFCVNSDNDAKVLRSLFQGINFGPVQPTILSCKFRPRHGQEMISRFEVQSENYPSLWAVMNIKNDVVANLILDRNQVETVLLIPTAAEAGQILKNVSTVPKNCKIAYTLNCDKYFPDPNYKVYSGPGQRPARFLQLSVGERATEVSRDIQNIKDAIQDLRKSAAEIRLEMSELQRQENASNDKIKRQRMEIQKLRAKLTHLMNQVGPPQPPNVSQIEEDKREQEERRNVSLQRVNSLKEDVKTAEQEYREADEIFSKFNNQISELSQTAHNMEKEMTEAEEEYHKWTNQLKVMKKKYKQVEQMKVELEKKVQSQAEKFSAELLMAEKFLPRKETNRSPIQIEREYKTLEVKLNKELTSYGDPVKIAEKLKEMTEKYKKLKAELNESKNLIGKLKKSLGERWLMGRNFRKVVSIVVKTSFVEILSGRKLRGKLLFDFDNETLTIQLAKNDGYTDVSVGDSNVSSKRTSQKRNQQEKLSMMSGGERSFCTVALILALWEVMDSPIRMLDEFDVFMDIVARRQSLDMMITHAKLKTQYIYLTPLEVNRGHIQEGVNIFRMPDPERT